MKLRTTPDGLIAEDGERWVRLEYDGDLLAFLGEPSDVRTAAVATAETPADPAAAGLPFRPRSIRAFLLWESHVIASSRMLVKNFFPPPVWKVASTFERVTGKPFPKLRPNERFREAPTFYVANHTAVL